jgi:BA14K-like protein
MRALVASGRSAMAHRGGGYCLSRYRSFDPMSGTYRGRDGRRHYFR